MLVVALVIVLVVLPLTELYVIIQVGNAIGYVPMLAALIACSLLGLYLVKRVGTGTWRRAQAQMRAGEIPAAEAVDGAMLLAAGILLLVPGFVTDAIGFLLLIPPVRYFPRRWARNHRFTRAGGAVYGRVIDVRGTAGPTTETRPAIEPPDSSPGSPRSP